MPQPIYLVIYKLENEENYKTHQLDTKLETNQFIRSLGETDVTYIKVLAGYVLEEREI